MNPIIIMIDKRTLPKI